jgi:hypothetical protein
MDFILWYDLPVGYRQCLSLSPKVPVAVATYIIPNDAITLVRGSSMCHYTMYVVARASREGDQEGRSNCRNNSSSSDGHSSLPPDHLTFNSFPFGSEYCIPSRHVL